MHFPSLSSFVLVLTILTSEVVSADLVPEDGALAKRAIPPPPTDTTFINTVLTRVNYWRNKHAATPLTWDATLANFAKTSASKCNGQHTVSFGNKIQRNGWTLRLLSKNNPKS
jgi:uncharacterized protein YkwD